MIPIIFTGSDEIITVTLNDGSGVIIPPSTLTDVIISCYQTKGEIIQQWLMSDGDVIVVSDPAGTVKVYLDRDNTINLPEKRLYLEVIVELANANFESGTQRTGNTGGGVDLVNTVT